MRRFCILLVVAVIPAAGEALSVIDNPWDTASDLLTSSSSNPELATQDVTDAGVNSPLDIKAADVPCSPLSNDQAQKRQPSKLRRRQACSLDRSQPKTIPPNAQEQGQQPHQISDPDNNENNPSGASANDAATISYLDFLDSFGLCNPMLVGINRKFPVCDSGKMRDRSIFKGRIDRVNDVMADGVYLLFDITPGI